MTSPSQEVTRGREAPEVTLGVTFSHKYYLFVIVFIIYPRFSSFQDLIFILVKFFLFANTQAIY